MGKGIFVVGTDTDVGKTFVTAGLAYLLKDHNPTVYKPIQSGGEWHDGRLLSPDIQFVKMITGLEQDHELMNSYCFEAAVSPHIAAERERETVDFQKIIGHYKSLSGQFAYTLVEGAGGVVVPLSRDYFVYDLIKDLDLSVVLVARAGVGTINHTALTVAYLKQLGIKVRAIVLNQYTGAYYEEDNMRILKELTGINNIVPVYQAEGDDVESLRNNYLRTLRTESVLRWFEEEGQ